MRREEIDEALAILEIAKIYEATLSLPRWKSARGPRAPRHRSLRLATFRSILEHVLPAQTRREEQNSESRRFDGFLLARRETFLY